MFNFKQIAVAAMMVAGSAGAQAANVTSITVTGGDFAMGAGAGASCGANGPFGNWQCFNTGTNFTINAGTASQSIGALFNFFGAPVSTFLAPSAAGAAPANDWTSGFAGSTTGNTISLNLGGFFANWSGTNFLQGTNSAGGSTSTAATGSYDVNTGAFDISWHSYITTAPFATQTGNWHMTGTATVAAVPVPAAAWLLGSGLLGLVGVARRSKAA